jgi:hypothetical protein
VLKTVVFRAGVAGALTALLALTEPAIAQDAPAALLTGSVRDQRGLAPEAAILVRDANGHVVGSARTAPDGTFAAILTGAPAAVDVRCGHCAALHAAVTAGEPAVLVVTRFSALENSSPDSADLRALPYRDPAQALALAPFTVAAQNAV